ncbi:MAG: lipopolysaccharide biosynthesis protein [Microbacterium sp.]
MTGAAPTSSLARSAANGAFVMLGAQGGKILLQLASVVALSRMLTPHDYGLIAIVLIVIGVGEIFRDFGLTSASVQAAEVTRGQRDNLFWVNTAIGAILAVLVWSLSWAISGMSGEADLLGILQVLCVVFLINGMTTQYRAQLMRELKFRALAMIEVTAAAIALGAAIIFAAAGAGYWALVAQQLASPIVGLIASAVAGRWLPRWYSRASAIGPFLRLGWNLALANLLSYGAAQIDTIVVAARFGAAPLGLYNRAYQLVTTPLTQVRTPLSNVAIPILSRIQSDKQRFDAFVTSGQLALGYALGLPLLLLAGLAEPVVQIMLGAQWSEAAPILRMFAIAGAVTTLSFVGYWIYVSRGLGSHLMRYTTVSTCIRAVCILVGSLFGLIGVSIGFAAAPALAWPLSLFWLSRVTDVPVRSLYGGALRILSVTGLAGVVSWLASLPLRSSPWAAVAVGALAGLGAACIPFLLARTYRSDARRLMQFARLMTRRNRQA